MRIAIVLLVLAGPAAFGQELRFVVASDRGAQTTLPVAANSAGRTVTVRNISPTLPVRVISQDATPISDSIAAGATGEYACDGRTWRVMVKYDPGAGGGGGSNSGIGACGASTWASTLNLNAAPTCTQPGFSDLSGAATDAQIPNTITVDLAALATTATTANAGDSATAFFSAGLLEVAIGGTGSAPAADDQLIVSSSSSAAAWASVGDCDDTSGRHLNYDTGTNAFSCGTSTSAPVWPTGKLTAPVAVAVNATYVPVFTITPGISKTQLLQFHILHTASATTIGVQFRVSSADAGNVGDCFFQAKGIAGAAASAVAEEYDQIAIGAAPADNASAAAGTTPINVVDIDCAFVSDGTPGDVLLEAQLETGTASINILTGSYYNLISN